LNALKGQPILARGKGESASAPPLVEATEFKPLIEKPRDSANLICGNPYLFCPRTGSVLI
jgi:hypothetical protein